MAVTLVTWTGTCQGPTGGSFPLGFEPQIYVYLFLSHKQRESQLRYLVLNWHQVLQIKVKQKRNQFSKNSYIILILLNYLLSYVMLDKPLSELSERIYGIKRFWKFISNWYPFRERTLSDQELYLKFKVAQGQARGSTS